MNANSLVILYSKYSKLCKEIVNRYDRNTMQHIRIVCIDNPKIRDSILNSKKYTVTSVPCVLLVYETKIEKFEGSGVYDWIMTHLNECNDSLSRGSSIHTDSRINSNVNNENEINTQSYPSVTSLNPPTSIDGIVDISDLSNTMGTSQFSGIRDQSALAAVRMSELAQTNNPLIPSLTPVSPVSSVSSVTPINDNEYDAREMMIQRTISSTQKKSAKEIAAEMEAERKSFQTNPFANNNTNPEMINAHINQSMNSNLNYL